MVRSSVAVIVIIMKLPYNVGSIASPGWNTIKNNNNLLVLLLGTSIHNKYGEVATLRLSFCAITHWLSQQHRLLITAATKFSLEREIGSVGRQTAGKAIGHGASALPLCSQAYFTLAPLLLCTYPYSAVTLHPPLLCSYSTQFICGLRRMTATMRGNFLSLLPYIQKGWWMQLAGSLMWKWLDRGNFDAKYVYFVWRNFWLLVLLKWGFTKWYSVFQWYTDSTILSA